MDVRHMLCNFGRDPAALQASDEQQTMVWAAEAMVELQRVQLMCMEANCGLNTVYYEGFIRMCLALHVHDQLCLINQQIETLLQAWQRNLQKQTQASPLAVPQRLRLHSLQFHSLLGPKYLRLQSLQRQCCRLHSLQFHALLGPKYLRLQSLQLLMPFMQVLECQHRSRRAHPHSNASVRAHRAQNRSARADAGREPGRRSRRPISQRFECCLFKSQKYMWCSACQRFQRCSTCWAWKCGPSAGGCAEQFQSQGFQTLDCRRNTGVSREVRINFRISILSSSRVTPAG